MTQMMREDHFSQDEVSKIKSCGDESVKKFYTDYLQAEALGDTEKADRLANTIKQRCKILGIDFVAESESGILAMTANLMTPYSEWLAKMEKVGADVKTDADTITESTAAKAFNTQGKLIGEFDFILDKEVFDSSVKLLKKYTVESEAKKFSSWKKAVMAEGATTIKTKGDKKVAYIGESRIGVFTRKTQLKEAKNFNQILKESMSFSISTDSNYGKTVNISATEDDADQLLSILQLSGLSTIGDADEEGTCPCQKQSADYTEIEEFSNKPNPRVADYDTQINGMSGGLNGPKRQINPNNPGDNPKAMKGLGLRSKSPQVNIEEEDSELSDEYKRFDKTSVDKKIKKNSVEPELDSDEKMITEKEPKIANQGNTLNQRLGLEYLADESESEVTGFSDKQVRLAQKYIKSGKDPKTMVSVGGKKYSLEQIAKSAE